MRQRTIKPAVQLADTPPPQSPCSS